MGIGHRGGRVEGPVGVSVDDSRIGCPGNGPMGPVGSGYIPERMRLLGLLRLLRTLAGLLLSRLSRHGVLLSGHSGLFRTGIVLCLLSSEERHFIGKVRNVLTVACPKPLDLDRVRSVIGLHTVRPEDDAAAGAVSGIGDAEKSIAAA